MYLKRRIILFVAISPKEALRYQEFGRNWADQDSYLQGPEF
jgi:hypothetical protein